MSAGNAQQRGPAPTSDDVRCDPDGLPLPDEATRDAIADLAREALTARPKATEWAILVASLCWAAEVGRQGPEGTCSAAGGRTS